MKQKIRFRMRYTEATGWMEICPDGHASTAGWRAWCWTTGMEFWPIVGRRVSQ